MEENFSYSKVAVYEDCPFKFKLIYRDGHYIMTDSIATAFGSAVHQAEEAIAKYIMAGETIDYLKVKSDFLGKIQKIQEQFSKDFKTPDKSKKSYSDKTQEYMKSGIYRLEKFLKKYPSVKIKGVEIPFTFEYSFSACPENKYIFKGFIDRVFYDEASKTYLIQDIKTYSKPVSKDKLETPLQFIIYTLAAEKMFEIDKNSIYCQYDLPLLNKVQQATAVENLEKGLANLNKELIAINNKEFMPNPSAFCAYCNFSYTNPDAPEEAKFLCPYHSVWSRDTKKRGDLYKSEVGWMGLANHEKILEVYQKRYGIIS